MHLHPSNYKYHLEFPLSESHLHTSIFIMSGHFQIFVHLLWSRDQNKLNFQVCGEHKQQKQRPCRPFPFL